MKPVSLEVTMMKRIGELKAERIHDLNQIGGLQEENARLKAEVEHLTKAGDAMASMLQFEETLNDSDRIPQSVQTWNAAKNGWDAAKEGKQS